MFLPYEAAPVLDLTTEGDCWKIQLDYQGPVPRAWRVDRRDLGGRGRRCVDVDGRRPGHRRGVHHILAGDRPAQTREEDAARVRGYRDAMSFVLRRADETTFKYESPCRARRPVAGDVPR